MFLKEIEIFYSFCFLIYLYILVYFLWYFFVGWNEAYKFMHMMN